ncbi:MAG: LysM peptidoglycan-binding domain-containing protein [Aestuariibacter sp.]
MKKLTPILVCLFISGCEMTPSFLGNQQPDPVFIAAEYQDECFIAPDVADLQFSCEDASDGTRSVIHPVSDLDSLMTSIAEPELAEDQQEVQSHTDLWQYIASQFNMPIPDNRRIWNQQKWYRTHPDYMRRVNKRATPFLSHIVNALEEHDMPLELALLPIVESAFDPFAYSHGRAAGMWQFIPGTAKRFGMKQNWWYDGRRDVIASTQGAIKYLKYLHKMFDGDWLHAIAAYNSGEGRVLRAIRTNKKRGLPTDFWHLDLPRETRAYVPKLLALSDLLYRSQEMDFPWPEMKNEPVTALVDVGSQIDLALAAEFAELTVEQLHALNPGFNRWATDPKGPHYLLLPENKVEVFTAALGDTSDRQRLNWVRHKITRGDSLLKLANQYHTSVDVIQQVNELRGNVIRAGDHLMIPVAQQSLDYYSLSEEQRLKASQNTRRASYQLQHVVERGDTMWDISRAYNVNLRNLAKWNNMAPTDPLRPGQKLAVWVNKVSEKQTDNAVMRSLTYTVRRGDSLARIADKFNVKIADLTRWNQLNSKKYLQPGQKLKIFVDVTRT